MNHKNQATALWRKADRNFHAMFFILVQDWSETFAPLNYVLEDGATGSAR